MDRKTKALDPRILVAWLQQNKLGIILLPWLAAAAGVLLAKRSMLAHGEQTPLFEIALSLRTPPSLHFWEKASLFRSDIMCYFFFVPLVFGLLTSRLSARWRVFIVILGSLLVEVLVYSEVITFYATGAFTSLISMWIAVGWAIKSHTTAFVSIHAITLFKIVSMLVVVGFFSLIALIALRANLRWLNHASLAVFGIVSMMGVIAWIPNTPAMPWTHTLLQMTATPAIFDSTLFSRRSGSVEDLLNEYRQASHIPAREPSAFTGKAKNYNVILFVLEAMTAQAFDPSRDSLDDMPNVRRLRDHSFLMERHYTSYPLTNAATFSIFTSMYDKSTSSNIISNRAEIPGLIRSLRDTGYETGFFGYVWKVPSERDDIMLASLGFEQIVEPKIDPRLDAEGNTTFYGPVEYSEAHDHQVLLSLRNQIQNWTSQHQRFAAAFFPEVGHDPYRDLSGHSSQSELERGHALAVHQDAWLGELLDELRKDGALDNTIIVLTADHGMRLLDIQNGSGVLLFSNGKIADLTLRVPMLIYVPGVLSHSQSISTPTSHIDITPTIFDLLGISEGRQLEQGSSVLSPGIEKRRLFLSMDIFGASGYYDRGYYYSRGPLDVVYKSPTMNFSDKDALLYDSKEAESVRAVLVDQDTRQSELLFRVLNGEYR